MQRIVANMALTIPTSVVETDFSRFRRASHEILTFGLRLLAHIAIWRQLTHTDFVKMLLICTLQKQAELLTSVGDDLVVKTMVPRFSTKVATPRNSCVTQTEFVVCLTDKYTTHAHHKLCSKNDVNEKALDVAFCNAVSIYHSLLLQNKPFLHSLSFLDCLHRSWSWTGHDLGWLWMAWMFIIRYSIAICLRVIFFLLFTVDVYAPARHDMGSPCGSLKQGWNGKIQRFSSFKRQ